MYTICIESNPHAFVICDLFQCEINDTNIFCDAAKSFEETIPMHMNPSQFNFKDDFLNQFFTCMRARMINDHPPCDKSEKENLVTGRVPTDFNKKKRK